MPVVEWVEVATLARVAKFGDVLRNLFDNLGLSQRDFAEKAGIATGTFNSALQAETPKDMNTETLESIAVALKKTPQQLIKIWKGDTGPDAVVRVLATYVTDPDDWLKKFALYLKWNGQRAESLIQEVREAAARERIDGM